MDRLIGVFNPLGDYAENHLLTRAIIDTIHEPLIVLDEKLCVVAASHSFYKKFDYTHENTLGKPFYELGAGQWKIPALRTLLEKIIPDHSETKGYEIELDSPFHGLRTLLINAKEIVLNEKSKKMLLSILDVTDRKALENEREALLAQKDILLKEMRHRIANSLQLIASILLLKASTVDSQESKVHLEDAHQRIMSIAAVQRQLETSDIGSDIAVAPYLTKLCRSLARSMIGGRKPIVVDVNAGTGSVSSDTAISFGLITTELVINAIKHAFPNDRAGIIVVTYHATDSNWVLSIEDNGVGQPSAKEDGKPGLGTSIIGALANQLQAVIRTENCTPSGLKISIAHTSF